MGKTTADKTIPPALRALGGWLSAEWFCSTILSDTEVVGITLPKLPGCRKQSFRLVERFHASGGPARAEPAVRSARRPQASLVSILDEFGASRAASFRRTTFLFEPAPVLYFAEIPTGGLKIRAADTLRRALVDSDLRCCVLRLEPKIVTTMFWPVAEHEISLFVGLATPPYPLHAQFDEGVVGQDGAGHGRGSGRASNGNADEQRERPLKRSERDQLLAELSLLRNKVLELQQSQSALGAMEALGLDDSRLKSMLVLLHPDKHGGSEAANETAKWVNTLRDLLKTARQ